MPPTNAFSPTSSANCGAFARRPSVGVALTCCLLLTVPAAAQSDKPAVHFRGFADFNFAATDNHLSDDTKSHDGFSVGNLVGHVNASLGGTFNGLSFVPADSIGQTGDDILVGTRNDDGMVFQVDPQTGAVTSIGNMGGLRSWGRTIPARR